MIKMDVVVVEALSTEAAALAQRAEIIAFRRSGNTKLRTDNVNDCEQ